MKHLLLTLTLLVVFHVQGQELDSVISKLTPFIQALNTSIPQEKVYLHFDNTSYYQGDNIWFKCFVVTSSQHHLSGLSKTLYVELLNPGGEIVEKHILKIENGQCHGDFSLTQLPFYSGFYEVRAYTKYMLNFGDDVIFSRLLPVFGKPKVEGNYEEKDMLRYGRWGAGNYPMKRERPEKGKAVNLCFFPEGGNLVRGVTSRIAFEATDEAGNPIDITGVVIAGNQQVLGSITTLHEGRGVFTYTPPTDAEKRKTVAEVSYEGKKYRFDLPLDLPQGVVMETDNVSHTDSMGISLRKSRDMPPEMFGVAIICGGKLQHYCFAWIEDDEISFRIDKTQIPSGVSQIVLFNSRGEILSDRLIFTGKNEFLTIKAKTNKPVYRPCELVEMELSVADQADNPMNVTFSLSVRDGANEVENNHTILTDLLLMSEIKGYVRNPSYYFEDDDETHRSALDLLLMVQGWRRYAWKQLAGVEPFTLKYLPEQGIETHGNIVTAVRQKPRPDVDVSLFLHQKKEETETADSFVGSFVTDSLGRFSFSSDVEGRWYMILSVTEKGKRKDHRIILDRVFSPDPKRYRYADLQVNIAEQNVDADNTDETSGDYADEEFDSFLVAYQDSLSKLGMDEKINPLPEVTIRAKKRTKEQDIYRNRLTSVAYYDVHSEMDDIYDSGKFVGNDIHGILKNMNPNFSTLWRGDREWMLYKNKMALFVVNYARVDWSSILDIFKYQVINVHAIKSIYINETPSSFCQYFYYPMESCFDVFDYFGCTVFIETYPEDQIPVEGAKGVRKTWMEGYSAVK